MDTPPLAGKIAALSLGALPVFYALNHVSVLSQCVQGARGRGARLGCEAGAGERMRMRGGPGSGRARSPSHFGMAGWDWIRTL